MIDVIDVVGFLLLIYVIGITIFNWGTDQYERLHPEVLKIEGWKYLRYLMAAGLPLLVMCLGWKILTDSE